MQFSQYFTQSWINIFLKIIALLISNTSLKAWCYRKSFSMNNHFPFSPLKVLPCTVICWIKNKVSLLLMEYVWCSPFRIYCWQVWSHFCPTSNKQPSPSLATNSDTKSSSPCMELSNIYKYNKIMLSITRTIINQLIDLKYTEAVTRLMLSA